MELNRLSRTDFVSKWLQARKGFSDSSQAHDKESAWEELTGFLDEFFPERKGQAFDSVSQEYWDRRETTMMCVKDFMKQHESKFFIVSEI